MTDTFTFEEAQQPDTFTFEDASGFAPLETLQKVGAQIPIEQAANERMKENTGFLSTAASNVPRDVGSMISGAQADLGKAVSTVANIPADVWNAAGAAGVPIAKSTPVTPPFQAGQSMLPSWATIQPLEELGKRLPADSTVGKLAKGIGGGLRNIAESFTTPENIALLGAMPEGVPGKIISAVFAGQAAYSSAKDFQPFVDAVKNKDWETATSLGTQILGSAAVAALAGSHALSKIKPSTTGEPNASKDSQAATVHGDVRAFKEPSGVVPVAQGSGGIQSQGELQPGTPQQESAGQAGNAPAQVRPDEGAINETETNPSIAGTPNSPAVQVSDAQTAPQASGESVGKVVEQPPIVDQPVNKPAETPLVAPEGQKYRVGKSPQTYTLVERLTPSETEKVIGEQPVRVKNDKTGKEEVMLESDLTPVQSQSGKPKSPKRDLDSELKASKLDPDSFPNEASKRAALKRAAAMADPSFRAKAESLAQKLEGLKANTVKKGKLGTFGIIPELWDNAINVAQAVIRGGGTVADAVDAFISHVKERLGAQFDESGARKHLQDYLSEPETTGIAARVSEERERRGLINEAPESGEGVAPKDSVERGQQLIENGVDPDFIVSQFKKTQSLSADDMAVVRARGQELAKSAKDAAKEHGTDSPEYEAAKQADNDWIQAIKPMQTEWSNIGKMQQGETEVDTGTFHGLQRAYFEETGEDFTPKQEQTAKETADKVEKADNSANDAKQELADHIDKETGGTDAEKRALAAANKTVREAAARAAESENKARVAKAGQERDAARLKVDADNRALKAAQQSAKDAAAKLAKADEEGRVKRARLKDESDRQAAEQAALDAANKTVREAAAKVADAENKKRVAKARSERQAAEEERKVAQKALDAANKTVREAAIKAAREEEKNRVNPELKVWAKVREYLDAGVNSFDDIASKIATDLGMTVDRVKKLMAYDKRAKYLADDAWRKQQQARRLKEAAKLWLLDQAHPSLWKIPRAIKQEAFNLKVLGHLSVGLGTHSPMTIFNPFQWGTFFRNYGRMWKLGLSQAAHESMMQDLTRRKNWTPGRRAGLENDPFQHEEYNLKGFIERVFPNLTHAGNRAYDVLKILRQDMFDKEWDKLPKTMQTDEMARNIADSVNHATGIVKKSPFGKASGALFAPRLLASRFAWAYGDPARAIATGARLLTDVVKGEKTVTPEDKAFAISQVREKATVVATMGALLAANQALLTASGSKQKINYDDPTKSDWLKFKGAGLDVSFGNAMLTTLRLPFREAAILWDNTKFSHDKRRFQGSDRGTAEAIFEYMRNQLNPAVGDVADVAFQNDAQGRPLPWSRQKVPAYLRKQGVKGPYTWGEWARDAAMPISLEESVKQVFNDYGVPKDQAEKWTKIIATAIYMGGTGGRISEDASKPTK
jgi:hypothetical protein